MKPGTADGSHRGRIRAECGDEAGGPGQAANSTDGDEVHVAGCVVHGPGADVADLPVGTNAYPRVTECPVGPVDESHPSGVHQLRGEPEPVQDVGEGPVVLGAEPTSLSECQLRRL